MPRRLAIPDASPRGAGRARRAAGRHGKTPHGACADSARRRDADTPGGGCARTARRSRSARGRSPGTRRSAPRSAGSCRAGSSMAEAAPMPLPKHWTARGKAGIKELPTRLPRRCAMKARGSDANQNPGLLFGLLSGSIADEITSAVADLYASDPPTAQKRTLSTQSTSAACGGRPRCV